MNFNYGEILTRAWKITWKFRALWLFGMLASCGQGGSNSNNVRNSYDSTSNQIPSEMMRQIEEMGQRMGDWFSANPWFIYALVFIVLLSIVIQIFIATVGQIGLVRGAYHADGGVETLRFTSLFTESLRYFWRLIGLALVIWLPFFILFVGVTLALIVGLVGLGGGNPDSVGAGMILFFIGFCCCLIPFIIALSLYYAQAVRALLIEELGVFESIQHGWRVFTGNLVTLLGVGFILFLIGLVVGVGIALPYFFIVGPLMIDFMNGNIQSWQPFINAGIFALIYFPIYWFLSGVIRTYMETAWTLTYLEISPRPAPPVALPDTNA